MLSFSSSICNKELCNHDLRLTPTKRKDMSTTQSIEKLYVSRKDNPVYSMLPQNDPCELTITCQSPDWSKEDTPPEHDMLIRSPPPIKRESPMRRPLNYNSSNRSNHMPTYSVSKSNTSNTNHSFIATADVNSIDAENGNLTST